MSENNPIVEKASKEKGLALLRISRMVDELLEEDEIFRILDRSNIMESLSNLMDDPPKDFTSITDDELSRRIEKVMIVEAMSGMLNDLAPKQIKSFEAAAKRRSLFR